ncbi:MAG: alpha-mannosidase [Armatimonadota bacterium]|nr:alpha-mannosidase [Armatimonadota bacterium]
MPFQQTKEQIFLRKIWRRKEEIKNHLFTDHTPVSDILVRETPNFESYQEAVNAPGYRPIRVGEQWGGGTNAWFKMSFSIPEYFRGREVFLLIDIDGEGCVFLHGKPYQGIDRNHPAVLLTRNAAGGERFELVIDAVSKHWMDFRDQSPKTLRQAAVAVRNPEVWEYWFNLDFLHQLAEALPEDSPRRAKIIFTLNKSVDAFDYTHTDAESLKQSALRANEILRPLLVCKSSASATNVAVHGHSHIDVAWLWPYAETRRKCARTFSTVMRLMDWYPEYIFSQSQAQLYQFTKENYPSLYAEIKQRAKEGRWDVTGSMWVEADCNLCSGESLVRQILLGKNFFKDEFGIETDVLWLPDVFGYSAALPQILKKAGINYFSTIKINWSQLNRFPYTTFYWRGIDGTRVLAHFPPTTDYNALPTPQKLLEQVKYFVEKDRCDWSLLSYGWGDGGGGPDPRHLEYLRRAQDLEGLPRCRQMKISEFFHTIDGTPDLPEWVGELYLELHRGTYTTQAKNKRFNRKAELLYRDAEILSSIADGFGLPYPYDTLHREWQRILCNQFHDVLPGSSVRAVYEDTDKMYPEILAVGESVASSAVDKISERVDTDGPGEAVVVVNTLPWDRRDVACVELPGQGEYAVLDPEGKEVRSQVDGQKIRFAAEVPSVGYAVYRLVKRKPTEDRNEILVSSEILENRFFRIRLDSDGLITSIIEKTTGREVVPQGERANLLQLFEDKPNDFDAWDIDLYYDDKWEDITGLERLDVVETGPVCGAVRLERKFGKSRIKQTIRIYADVPRIDFETWVDWHEDHKCLKAAFPVDVNTSKARYEIQFGSVERPTHTNTSWDLARFEVCAHKWADVSEEGFGVSLMNDCKYGHHTKGNVMRLTLLRSPKDPDETADMGEHEFTYALMPHGGSFVEAETVRRAYELNVPLRVRTAQSSPGELPKVCSFISVDAPNVVLETVKRAEKEDAVILRFYECHNRRAHVNVSLRLPFRTVHECDLMERSICEVLSDGASFSFDIKPFEIKTFKLVK